MLSQVFLSLLPVKVIKFKRKFCKLAIKYQFSTFKRLWHNGITFLFTVEVIYRSPYFSLRFQFFSVSLASFHLSLFKISVCYLLCRVSSATADTKTLTLRTKLHFANTIHTSSCCCSHSKECLLTLHSAMLNEFFTLMQEVDFYAWNILTTILAAYR